MVRTLVGHGADVEVTVPGSILYNAISAACLGSEARTMFFILSKGASAELADPISGRVPLHFAAPNGTVNFEALLLYYTGDMMIADNGGKNCLHWAAQFGNAMTVDFIVQDERGKAGTVCGTRR
ncbi:hypothetical protein AJ79_05220 [Helicocarpus griseus UAMH5409]|uniref:Uncharacterized protein n=1 Tax=Helicocarpus griseus UAMH5409 TaxID=1447875 RepID=A0A2B7XPI4_9EURO|nr:hypothetical protein AJ79_05220 [Helicocarpus griseus UAMH5409]